MPYFLDENLEKDQETENPGEVKISGASPTSDSEGHLDTGGQSNSKGLNTGSGYQNLDKYLKMNQPQQFGQQLLGKVGETVTGAQKQQQDVAGKFKEQVGSSNYTPTETEVNSAIANPTGANKENFQTWENQSYKGPNNLAENQDLYKQYWSGADKAKTQAGLLGNEAGRFSLLDTYFGRPNYTYGQKSLDNLLAQQSGLGKEKQALQNQATALKTQGQQQAKELQDIASKRAGEVEQSRNQVRGAIGIDENGQVITGDKAGAIGKQWNAIDQAVAAQNAQRQAQNAHLSQALSSGNLSDADRAQLGLGAGGERFNLNLANYFTPGQALSKEQVMTPEQQAYIRALSELSGVTDTYAGNDLRAKTDPYSFDVGRFNADVNSTRSQYQTTLNDSLNAIRAQAEQEYQNAVNQSASTIGQPGMGMTGGGAFQHNDMVAQLQAIRDQQIAQRSAALQAQLNQQYGIGNRY